MAEEERKTKAERRAEARAERKRKEEEAARQRRRESIRNGIIAALVVAVIAIVAIPAAINAFGGDDGGAVTIAQAAAVQARQDAGCEMVVDNQPLPNRDHHEAGEAPPADVLYAGSPVRPTHSGPHFSQPSGAVGGAPNSPLDERALTHNLEHGSVIVWFDPAQVDDDTVAALEDWMQSRKDMGFTDRRGGHVFVSPYEGFTDDRPIAIRAWGFALNCEEWDQTVADSMIIDYWGTHGFAPEASLSPYPSGSLDYGEQDGTESPAGGSTEEATGEPTSVGGTEG